ncbi:hypothetical protein D3C80_924230 [compost metagenome]
MPCRLSMYCSSSPVPRVATTRAWVSPRVNSDEPWVRGRTPTSETMARTLSRARPSTRCAFSMMSRRRTSASHSLKAAENLDESTPSGFSSVFTRAAAAVFLAASTPERRSYLPGWA